MDTAVAEFNPPKLSKAAQRVSLEFREPLGARSAKVT